MALLDNTLLPGQTSHIADHQQIAGKLNDLPNVVRDYGAVGDADNSGNGTNNTTAIQQAYTDAAAADGAGIVLFPGVNSYRIDDTINIPAGVHTLGLGGRKGNLVASPTQIIWGNGAPTDRPMFLVDEAAQNIPQARFENICLGGRNVAQDLLVFRGLGGNAAKLDTGSNFIDCNFQGAARDCLRFETNGITNAVWQRGRFDQWGGCAVRFVQNTSLSAFFTMRDFTADNWVDGQTNSSGFFRWEGDTMAAGNLLYLNVSGFHCEVNGSMLEANPSGTTDFDKRGVFQFGLNDAISNNTQVLANFEHCWLAASPTTAQHSFILPYGGDPTTDQHPERLTFSFSGISRITNSRSHVVGNIPAAWEFPTNRSNIGASLWGKGTHSGEVPYQLVKTS